MISEAKAATTNIAELVVDFTRWRASRTKHERTLPSLLERAVSMARIHGAPMVARALSGYGTGFFCQTKDACHRSPSEARCLAELAHMRVIKNST